jgi:hypothetical protein
MLSDVTEIEVARIMTHGSAGSVNGILEIAKEPSAETCTRVDGRGPFSNSE